MGNAWDIESYPDEAGLRSRLDGVIQSWADEPYAQRSQAPSACPDTGLPVRTWALEGEPIISPYTGRRYLQGPTGYFGPKERDAEGRITRFGGDPLKYVLPAVTARLLVQPDDAQARAFVSIPGNLRQQYHFAAVGWGRFLGLAGARMDASWHAAFRAAVADYRETRHPSDGERELANPPSVPFDLVGEPGYLLGGNPSNGGTENHKVMWRTTGLLYAQLFGAGDRISGHPAPVAAARTTQLLRDFLQRVLTGGNGEYDSVIYYYYAVLGYLNLFDFSPDPDTRMLARMTLDFYFATYGLKRFAGVLAGPSKRGFSSGFCFGDTERMFDAFCPSACRPAGACRRPSLYQATTQYRPNRVLCNLIEKRVALPFEARMARPSYHMDRPNRAQESFFCARDFALGSVALTELDNPIQQTVWSLATRGAGGPLVMGGGQPRFRSPQGHSPFDQVFQHRHCLVLVTAPTTAVGGRLDLLPRDLPSAERWAAAPHVAETWLYVPKGAAALRVRDDLLLLDAGSAHVAVWSLGDKPFTLAPPTGDAREGDTAGHYDVVVFAGLPTGFVLEARSAEESGSLDAFEAAVRGRARLDRRDFGPSGRLVYRTMDGDDLEVTHDRCGLRCRAAVNGRPVDWDRWCGGGVYDSPYLKIGEGRMTVSDGSEAYEMRAGPGGMGYRAL